VFFKQVSLIWFNKKYPHFLSNILDLIKLIKSVELTLDHKSSSRSRHFWFLLYSVKVIIFEAEREHYIKHIKLIIVFKRTVSEILGDPSVFIQNGRY